MSETVATSRYLAIDFFRGLTIALMIIVNTPGDWEHVFAPLRHAEWHGCTLADWIFPFFLYIVGVSAWFSFEKYHQKLSPALARKILRRAGLIFLIGVALNAYPFVHTNWPELRIMGVMQRIGLAYGLAAFLCLSLNKKQLVIASGLLLVGYWAALWFGGTGDPYSIETNLVRQIDLAVLGAAHLNHGISIPFESEGLLSTLPAVVTVIIGYLTGGLIADKKQDKKRLVSDFLKYGLALTATGLPWGAVFPIIKLLWTSSFVLYTAGLAMIFLAFCIWALDVRGWQTIARPFLVFGANPLFAYVLSSVAARSMLPLKYTDPAGKTRNAMYWIYEKMFYPVAGAELGSLLFALSFTAVIWLVCRELWRRKIFVKI
ncbi:MAG: DUF1624 domain-containing protein [Saprospiraceae bacterium]|nr:DUF1624 domain-containing protein [Saprospiraceae bacterium]